MLRINLSQTIDAGHELNAGQLDEDRLVRRFAERVSALGPLSQASLALRRRVMEEVKSVARRMDARAEVGSASGNTRRILHDDPTGWTLAAIILRPGQQIHPHNHDGWGCAVTVQGVERNRWFVHDKTGNLVLRAERDYPPGAGYIFNAEDIHQPFGADPRQVTVALHFLANPKGG